MCHMVQPALRIPPATPLSNVAIQFFTVTAFGWGGKIYQHFTASSSFPVDFSCKYISLNDFVWISFEKTLTLQYLHNVNKSWNSGSTVGKL